MAKEVLHDQRANSLMCFLDADGHKCGIVVSQVVRFWDEGEQRAIKLANGDIVYTRATAEAIVQMHQNAFLTVEQRNARARELAEHRAMKADATAPKVSLHQPADVEDN